MDQALDAKPSKLSKLTKQTVTAGKADLDQSSTQLIQEMEADWEKDWV
jgi:hypothetical protein